MRLRPGLRVGLDFLAEDRDDQEPGFALLLALPGLVEEVGGFGDFSRGAAVASLFEETGLP